VGVIDRLRDHAERAGSTVPDGLRFPEDYEGPADVPATLQTLAQDTQAALVARADSAAASLAAGLAGRVPLDAVQVADWDLAVTNGTFWGNTAGNSPAGIGGHWLARVIRHASDPGREWVTQCAWPLAISGIDSSVEMRRHCRDAVWEAWYRAGNHSASSWDGLDNFVFHRHGGSSQPGGAAAQRVWAVGNRKDPATPAVTNGEQFRIQRYDLSGNYAGNVMTASMAGVVQFPGGHSRLLEARERGDAIPADTAATVGVVADMILTALVRLQIIPRERIADVEGILGVHVAAPSPEFDPPNEQESI
jgi:hypothetical protein